MDKATFVRAFGQETFESLVAEGILSMHSETAEYSKAAGIVVQRLSMVCGTNLIEWVRKRLREEQKS